LQIIDGLLSGNKKDSGVRSEAEVGPGATRQCFDPWTMVKVRADDGAVFLCCVGDRIAGNVKDGILESIVNGDSARELRRRLLDGELDGMLCKSCPAKPIVTVEEFRKGLPS